jgi:hypothetical protein
LSSLQGGLHAAIQQPLCAANLIPLSKKDGGIRPIAVGDVLRRVAGKVLLGMPDTKRELECLKPRQFGVGVPFAAEMVGMGIQRLADGHLPPDVSEAWVQGQYDVKNAYNTMHRSAFLQGARRQAPTSYNWLAWAYSFPAPLICQGKIIAYSKTGVHQGDSMAPTAFALGLDEALQTCAEQEAELPWVSWYLDDGTVVGPLDKVAAYTEALVPALAAIGLDINTDKSVVWGPGIMKEGEARDTSPEEVRLGHPIRSFTVVPFGQSTGVTVLGVPCDAPGSFTQAKNVWAKAVGATTSMLDKLRRLPDGQIRHALLRHCLDACKLNHLMRAVSCEVGTEAITLLSDAPEDSSVGIGRLRPDHGRMGAGDVAHQQGRLGNP